MSFRYTLLNFANAKIAKIFENKEFCVLRIVKGRDFFWGKGHHFNKNEVSFGFGKIAVKDSLFIMSDGNIFVVLQNIIVKLEQKAGF